MVVGMTTGEIAAHLGVDFKAAEHQVGNVRKAFARVIPNYNRVRLALWAIEHPEAYK